MLDPIFGEYSCEVLTLCNADGSNQNWLAIGITFNDVLDDRIEFCLF
ncbi:unannotated protein [freshwater metagenome]|uniref:Unannotated protein n=1 Tax=freshwater metagenome TaxID=449393 RepID=A0A6J6H042_9ZZZZ